MKKETRISTNQKRKLTMELLMLAVAVIGVIITVCNFFKIVPESNYLITAFIAYGFLSGPAMVVLGIGGFFEIRNTRVSKFSKKAR